MVGVVVQILFNCLDVCQDPILCQGTNESEYKFIINLQLHYANLAITFY